MRRKAGPSPAFRTHTTRQRKFELMTTFSAQAMVKAEDIDGCLPVLLEHMEEHATVNLTDTGARLVSPFGTVEICRRSDGLLLEASSGSVEVLSMIKEFVAEHVFEFAGESASIVWSDECEDQRTPAHFQELVVTDVCDVTSRLRRVRFSCARIEAFTGDAGYHVRLLFPPNKDKPVWPTLNGDGRLSWPSGDDVLAARVYTVRHIDIDNCQLDIDFVLHEAAGPASDWAVQARAGDVIGMLGPSGGPAPSADHYLIAGDETALPAIVRLLDDLPAKARGVAFIEVQSCNDIQVISHSTHIELRWLVREAAAAGTTTLLQEAIRAMPEPAVPETFFAWISCEFTACNAIRAHLRGIWNLPKGRYLATSYWRRGKADDGILMSQEGRDDH